MVAPKKAKLAEAEAEYSELMVGLSAKKAELKGLEDRLAALNAKLAEMQVRARGRAGGRRGCAGVCVPVHARACVAVVWSVGWGVEWGRGPPSHGPPCPAVHYPRCGCQQAA